MNGRGVARSTAPRRLAAFGLALLTSCGPLAREAAAQVAAAEGAASAAVGASASGAAALSAAPSTAGLPRPIAPLTASLTAASPLSLAAASAAAPTALAGPAALAASTSLSVIAPAASASAAPAAAPGKAAATGGVAAATPKEKAPKPASSAATPAVAPARAPLESGIFTKSENARPRREARGTNPSAERLVGFSARLSALPGDRLFDGRGEAAPESAATPASSTPPPLAATLSRARSRNWTAAVGAVLVSLPLVVYPASLGAGPAQAASAWHVVSQFGYIAGNAAAAAFPLFQIHSAFKGRSTPAWRAAAGVAASLALALISAAVLHEPLWGIQNLFGGLTLFAPLLIKRLPRRFLAGGALRNTVLLSTALFAVSLGLYFPLAAASLAALRATLSPQVITRLLAGIQWATAGLFLTMFVPDTVRMLRRKRADSFASGFNLMYFLTMLAFLLWAFPLAWMIPGAAHKTYQVIFATTTIEAILGFVSYVFSRRMEKNPPPPQG